MNYEKAYNEALERARDLHDNHPLGQPQTWMTCEKIFPELKESEDEQHRKWILEYLYDGLRKSDEQFKDQFKSAIAWLKKQGHVKKSPISQHENKTSKENDNSLTSEDERIRKELISFITDRKNWFPKEETKASWIAWLEKQVEQRASLNEEDNEDGLTEFEKMLRYVLECYSGHEFANESEIETLKLNAKSLLDLARKEIESNYYDKVLDDRMVFKSELHATDLQTSYDIGKQDALKDLPKWKRVPKTWKVEDNAKVVFSEDYKYYMDKKELFNKLPKE